MPPLDAGIAVGTDEQRRVRLLPRQQCQVVRRQARLHPRNQVARGQQWLRRRPGLRHVSDASADLRALADDGYCPEIRDAHLLVHDVPYATADGRALRGTLVSPLDLANDLTVPPGTHVVWWIGEHPCRSDGRAMRELTHAGGQQLAGAFHADHSCSHKPVGIRDPVDAFYVRCRLSRGRTAPVQCCR